jgi:hypothetical protein
MAGTLCPIAGPRITRVDSPWLTDSRDLTSASAGGRRGDGLWNGDNARPSRWRGEPWAPRSPWRGCCTKVPHVLLIPGTSSLTHLEQNMAAARIALDDEDLAALAGVSRQWEE